MGLKKKTLYILAESFLRIFIFLIFLYTESLEPFKRIIQPEEWWLYKNPVTEDQTINTSKLFLISFLTPVVTILIFSGFFCKEKQDFVPAFLSSSLILVLNGFITNCIKLGVGRPRPDFFFRCFPDGKPPDGQPSAFQLECTGSHDRIIEGRKSFPSGHSSFAFAGLGFCSLYICGKLKCFNIVGRGKSWRLIVALLPLLGAIMIAISRTCDYRHHWQDVLVGSLLGCCMSYLGYRQYYPRLDSNQCHLPLIEQPQESNLANGSASKQSPLQNVKVM